MDADGGAEKRHGDHGEGACGQESGVSEAGSQAVGAGSVDRGLAHLGDWPIFLGPFGFARRLVQGLHRKQALVAKHAPLVLKNENCAIGINKSFHLRGHFVSAGVGAPRNPEVTLHNL